MAAITVDRIRAAVAADLIEARVDRANFSCPETCEHIGCVEARAACDGRIDALTRLQATVMPPTHCRECGLQLAEYEIDRGYEHCLACRGQDEDMAPSRMGR